jgi:hypothetical protein
MSGRGHSFIQYNSTGVLHHVTIYHFEKCFYCVFFTKLTIKCLKQPQFYRSTNLVSTRVCFMSTFVVYLAFVLASFFFFFSCGVAFFLISPSLFIVMLCLRHMLETGETHQKRLHFSSCQKKKTFFVLSLWDRRLVIRVLTSCFLECFLLCRSLALRSCKLLRVNMRLARIFFFSVFKFYSTLFSSVWGDFLFRRSSFFSFNYKLFH